MDRFLISDNKVEYIIDDKVLAYVTFPKVENDIVLINHTVVDESLRGKGFANLLMEACYNTIKNTKRRAMLECSYAIKWYEKNIDKQDILVK